MGTLGQLCYRAVVWWSRLCGVFSFTKQLHTARFARLDELQNLLSKDLDSKPSLLLDCFAKPASGTMGRQEASLVREVSDVA